MFHSFTSSSCRWDIIWTQLVIQNQRDNSCIESLLKSKNQGDQHQKPTRRVVWLLRLNVLIKVREKTWCPWREHKKLYKKSCLIMKSKQDLKEISSFEAFSKSWIILYNKHWPLAHWDALSFVMNIVFKYREDPSLRSTLVISCSVWSFAFASSIISIFWNWRVFGVQN